MKKFFTSLLALLGLAACGQQGYENADVNGFAAQIAKSGQSAQHHGLGSALVERACAIASETGFDAINVISAVGTRDYYRKLGFTDNGLYQTRRLSLSR